VRNLDAANNLCSGNNQTCTSNAGNLSTGLGFAFFAAGCVAPPSNATSPNQTSPNQTCPAPDGDCIGVLGCKQCYIPELAGGQQFLLEVCPPCVYAFFNITRQIVCNPLWVGYSILNSSNQIPPVNNSVGHATAAYKADFVAMILSIDITWAGLSSNTTEFHIHSGNANTNGPIIFQIFPADNTTTANGSAATSTVFGNSGYSSANWSFSSSNINDLINANYYVNIHTVQNPSGEIRGQIILYKTDKCIPVLCPNSTVPTVGCPFWDTACNGLTFAVNSSIVDFHDFDFISFGNLAANTGDIQGAAAVGGNVSLGNGFSIGDQITANLPFSLIVNENLTWGSGALFPANSQMFVGGSLNAPPDLAIHRTNVPCFGCLTAQFNAAQTCYLGFSNAFAALAANTNQQVLFSSLMITCQGNASQYVVQVSPQNLAQSTGYLLSSSCNSSANFVINIIGVGNVGFSGGSFPTVGQLLYNIPGGNLITVSGTAVTGSILAPNSNFIQNGGVVMGKVVVGNAALVLQINVPICPSTPPS